MNFTNKYKFTHAQTKIFLLVSLKAPVRLFNNNNVIEKNQVPFISLISMTHSL